MLVKRVNRIQHFYASEQSKTGGKYLFVRGNACNTHAHPFGLELDQVYLGVVKGEIGFALDGDLWEFYVYIGRFYILVWLNYLSMGLSMGEWVMIFRKKQTMLSLTSRKANHPGSNSYSRRYRDVRKIHVCHYVTRLGVRIGDGKLGISVHFCLN